ncbi:MAG: 16S rRNA (guanine(966)-N(2))-methyltransferase RsmD [Myxococcales bacterium]|nr:16S rRNA (guanine(966)-N(2))-methyltransferase RsmD [Myxococcales bacterium]
MRIIGGQARGRPLTAPRGTRTKPTTDRVREGMFSMIASRLDLASARVLDLFAGSGALALESISRGAERALLVDSDNGCARVIAKNAETLGFAARVEVSRQRVESALARLAEAGRRFDLVLADPPYDEPLLPLLTRIADAGVVADDGLLVVEHSVRTESPELAAPLQRVVLRRYGDTVVSVYEPMALTDEPMPRDEDED